jgi:hypothetical protein
VEVCLADWKRCVISEETSPQFVDLGDISLGDRQRGDIAIESAVATISTSAGSRRDRKRARLDQSFEKAFVPPPAPMRTGSFVAKLWFNSSSGT